jgi:hypothetical protein
LLFRGFFPGETLEELEVITSNDAVVAAFASPDFERGQNSLDAGRLL